MNRFLYMICIISISLSYTASSHCQIPCGIYDDQMRINQMKEHVITIEKSMQQLLEKQNDNQKVRWVLNKEDHADKISDIVTYYFMAQRIKPNMEGYSNKLSLLHEILVSCMKAKQSTDSAVIKKLNALINNFEHAYIGDHK